MKKILSLFLLLSVTNLYSNTITHTVNSGETLYGLALKYHTSTDLIMSENGLESTALRVGQKLEITSLAPDEYKVITGDTLSGIAFKNDITLKHLLLVNRIDVDYQLKPGEILRVPTTPELKREYTVQKGDTISWISMTYNIDSETLIKINNIKNNNLKPGDIVKLIDTNTIPVKKASVTIPTITPEKTKNKQDFNGVIYSVKKGDTLSGIAWDYQTTVDDIKQLNDKTLESIRIGEKLKLPLYAKLREEVDYNIYHTVKSGDTLSGISYTYNISMTLLRELNNLPSDVIKVGQKIKLIPQESRTHIVKEGETLWSIARKYNLSVDQIMLYNHLNSTLLSAGRELSLYDYKIAKHNNTTINLVAMQYNKNLTERQPHKDYSKNELIDPLEKYNKAKDLWKKYAKQVNNETKISDILKGWTIVLDPGHGGKDPGAIASVNLNGKQHFIVEDEYAYDTTVRLYELLKRNGADVYMTVLSPDHISRNPDSSTTFINEKNEVYNNYHLNKVNNSRVWPVGGQWGLNQRVEICNNIISATDNKRTMFISIHADNDIRRGKGKLILYNSSSEGLDTESRDLADMMIQDMGDDATAKAMNLGVLRGNEADVKVLVELRNMAHLSEALALLDNNKRQNDAQSILNGIKRYVEYFQE